MGRSVAAGPFEKRILLVDDDPALRGLMETVLVSAGYATHVACNAGEALNILRGRSAVDLLLTDVQMPPGPSGLELAEMIVMERPTLPVMVMSAAMLTEEQVKLIESKSWGFVGKPVPVPALLSQIAILLRKPRLYAQHDRILLPKAG